MATGEAKVIDNAIIGFMQQQRLTGLYHHRGQRNISRHGPPNGGM
jgi:hypothetical protein